MRRRAAFQLARRISTQGITSLTLPPLSFATCRRGSTAAQVQGTPPNLPEFNDIDITPYFDRSSSYNTSSHVIAQPTGLFGQPELASPASFLQLAQRTVNRAQLLVDRIKRSPSSHSETLKVVKNFDRLSDMLCGVIDAAELVRHSHPQKVWVEAAHEVYESMCSFMNTLNTDVDLYEVLRAVMRNHDVASTFSYEQRETALIFIRDFERSGIHLPPKSRSTFVALSDEVNVLSRTFSNPSTRKSIYVRRTELDGMPPGVIQKLTQQSAFMGKMRVIPGSWEALTISKYSPNEELRHRLHVAEMQPDATKVEALDGLLKVRDQLARLVGRPSFAEWSLDNKMAKSSDDVLRFLTSLETHERPLALGELGTLARSKQTHLNLPEQPKLNAWDRDFYLNRLQAETNGGTKTASELLFAAGSAFQALSRMFTQIYGMRLEPREPQPGEVWHPDVKRLDVMDETDGLVGVIYVDLWARRGKHSGAAHYTVRCSRRVDDDDADADFADGEIRATGQADIMQQLGPMSRTGRSVYQLPIAALVCEFVPPADLKIPTGLAWGEVKTLFHEMGHAMHSMIARTEYQNVSGTRCSTDFVELPSTLMEKFLVSPAVLGLFPSTPSAPIPSYAHLQSYLARSNSLPALETHTHILMAILDQTYHSHLVSSPSFSSTSELHKLETRLGLFPPIPGTAWQTNFTHLDGYGATYYTYLFCRAIARKVWKTLFEGDPLSRVEGERYKREVLRYGGGRDPWEMVAKLLEAPEVVAGDNKAMEIVGKWGVEQ
ncbi:Mitochondrial intermediate peptidase [Tulasnella sp. 330]|nr:Mitochondrial intermediate peptidase [Tulasnella sp. 330]KAG8873143.1 Mitochondrial intermediate peptidase [Tulasnella sp. 331]KAG8876971.1 Mitochondrial intermediate peptidase [Tulasnella sp. 332]